MVVVAAVPALVGFPLGWAREPDPLCGRRVSIRPQPTRAPRGEVMALGPFRWGGPARAVAGGPTPAWGGGGMAWDPAAAALRLSLALGAARGVSGDSPPLSPPPPPGRTVAANRANRANRARRLTKDWLGWNLVRQDATPSHLSPPLPTALAPLRPAASLFCPWHGDREDGAEGEGVGTPARPPHSPGAGGGTMASPCCCGGGTARPPRCSPPPTNAGGGPAPPVTLPPSRGCGLGSCASRPSLPGPGMGGVTPTTSAWTALSGCPPSRALMAPSLEPTGPPSAKPCSGGTPGSSSRAPPGRTHGAPASPTHGAGTWRQCVRRRPARRCGGRPGTAGWCVGTPPDCYPPPPLQSPPPCKVPPPPPGHRHFHVFLVNMNCAGLCCPSALRMALHCFPGTTNGHVFDGKLYFTVPLDPQ